jgi:hypothetical protein
MFFFSFFFWVNFCNFFKRKEYDFDTYKRYIGEKINFNLPDFGKIVYYLQFYVRLGPKSSLDKGRSWRTDCPLKLATCHKFGQGDHVCSLHEFNKSVRVGEA